MIDLAQLQQLIAVSEYGTISAAAEALHLSQPALTRSLQRLEADLGVSLFDRKRNRAAFNRVGLLAVAKARGILDSVREMADELRLYEARLSTVAVGSCSPAPMWDLASELAERFPGKTISSELGETDTLIGGLMLGNYQLILIDRPLQQEGVLCKKYAEEQLCIALVPSHPLSGRTSISLSELENQGVLQYRDMGIWHRVLAKDPHPHYLVQNDLEALLELIQASEMPTFSSDLVSHRFQGLSERSNIPLSDEGTLVSFYLCAMAERRELFKLLC